MASGSSVLLLPPSVTLETVEGSFGRTIPYSFQGNRGLKVCCPAHPDRTPSLAFWESASGRLMAKCWGKCSADSVKAALPPHWFDEVKRTGMNIVATYSYFNEDGVHCADKLRIEPKDFRVSWLGEKGQYVYNLKGVYDAIERGLPIFWNEGEKAADEFVSRGVCGTCLLLKGGPPEWFVERLRAASSRPIINIIQDNDKAGEEYANATYAALSPVANVSILRGKSTQPKADAYDHFREGFDVAGFEHRAMITSDIPQSASGSDGFASIVMHLDKIERIPMDWLWYPYFPKRNITMVQGDGEAGKSYFMHGLCAFLSRGELPGFGRVSDPVKSLIFSGEDEAEYVTIPRLQMAAADLSMIHQVQIESGFTFSDDVKTSQLIEYVGDNNIGLIVVDPFSSFSAVENSADATMVREVMNKLLAVSRRTGAACVTILHQNKKGTFLGSVEFRNVPKSQLAASKHAYWSSLTHEKSNYAPRGPAISYQISDDGITINGCRAGTIAGVPAYASDETAAVVPWADLD